MLCRSVFSEKLLYSTREMEERTGMNQLALSPARGVRGQPAVGSHTGEGRGLGASGSLPALASLGLSRRA